jgi:hypothetical protein
VNFDEYLHSKKIDSAAFRAGEEDLWEGWKKEFQLLSESSFTSQKLYLINPIRRKYPFTKDIQINTSPAPSSATEATNESIVTAKPSSTPVARPVFRPKPKMN